MKVLVVENYRGSPAGIVGEVLAGNGAALDIRRPYDGDALPAGPQGHDAIVVLGGAQSALDDADYPYLPELCRLIRGFGDGDRAVLGICLGLQLVARAYGGENLLGRPVEFGYRPIHLLPEGAADPVLGPIDPEVPLFQWHGDTVTLPPGATHLATNDHTAVQAFRIGRKVYATQFHFEASRRIVRDWSDSFPDQIAEHAPDWRARAGEEIATTGAAADALGAEIARRWMALI